MENMDQRRKGTNPVRPSSPRPIHRRNPAAASQSGVPPGTDPGSSAGKPLTLDADQRRKWTRAFVPNPVRPSSPRPIHRRIPAAASQSGIPPGTDPGSSAGKPLTLETDQRRKGTRAFVPNPVRPSSPRPIHRRIPAAASQSGVPPGTDPGSSAGKPLTLEMALNAPQPLWDGPKPQWVKNMEVCMERRKEFGGWHKSATQPAGKPDFGFTKPRQKTPYGSPHFYSFSPFPSPCYSPCGSDPGYPSGSPLGSNPGSSIGPPCGSNPGCPNGSPRGSKPGFPTEFPHSSDPGSPCGPPGGSNSDSPCGSPHGSNPGLSSGRLCGSDPGSPSGFPSISDSSSSCWFPSISDSSSSSWFPSISDSNSPCGSPKGSPHGSNPISPCGSPKGSPHGSNPISPCGSPKGSPHGSDPVSSCGSPKGSPHGSDPVSPSGSPKGSPHGSDPGFPSASPCISDSSSLRWFPSISDSSSPCGSPNGLPHGSNPVSPCGSPRGSKPISPSGSPQGSHPVFSRGSPHGSHPVFSRGSLHGSHPGSPVASSELPLTYSDQPQVPTSSLKAGPSRRPCAPSAPLPSWRGPEQKWVKNIRRLMDMRNQGRGRKRAAAVPCSVLLNPAASRYVHLSSAMQRYTL
ncbi:basic salivary proline-rich protein 1-like [Etheostoma cragini]|uniref:basic salivary proline-rich protein 1-like n=1 Tax=Etheostoma cragini TaxID=417921 RepID=UPI00155ECAA3|nr:basic salivary proline-rich protein 1-like [Etheostoma cragini]